MVVVVVGTKKKQPVVACSQEVPATVGGVQMHGPGGGPPEAWQVFERATQEEVSGLKRHLQMPLQEGGGGRVVVVDMQGVLAVAQSTMHGVFGMKQGQVSKQPLVVLIHWPRER